MSPTLCRAQVITTVAGINNQGYAGDGGPATSASLSNPEGIVIDSAGNLYFADKGNYAVREVNAAGTINTVAGPGSLVFGTPLGDGGPATSAQILPPIGLAVDAKGNLYIAESGAGVPHVRKVDASGIITTFAGSGNSTAPGYAGLYQVAIQVPTSLANGDWPIVATMGSAALFNVTSSPSGVTLTVQN